VHKPSCGMMRETNKVNYNDYLTTKFFRNGMNVSKNENVSVRQVNSKFSPAIVTKGARKGLEK
jgi:hypothetical protein